MTIEIIHDIDDIHHYLITNETAAFYLRYKGTGWKDDGIFDNDVLVIDKSLPLKSDQLIIAAWAGKPELKLKRYIVKDGTEYLMDNTGTMEPVLPDSGFEVWGVVAHVIHSL